MANLNLNKVILGGRLTADVELKTTPSGVSVCSFSLAVGRKYTKQGEQPQTDFINCVAWRTTAEFISRYFKKGSCICVIGSIQTRSYTAQDGTKRYATEVVADEATFVEKKASASDNSAQGGYNHSVEPTTPQWEEVSGDEELPF
jgi:single-strand DNA-binding protein